MSIRVPRDVPGTQEFGHAPGLGDAAAWSERWLAVEDLADAAHAVVSQMAEKRLQEGTRPLAVAVDPQMRRHERADQPGPDGALVIGRIPLPLVAAVAAEISRIAGRRLRRPWEVRLIIVSRPQSPNQG